MNLSDDKEKKGYVTFDVTFNIDPILLSYEKQLSKYTEDKKPTNTNQNTVPTNTNTNTNIKTNATDASLQQVGSILDDNTIIQ